MIYVVSFLVMTSMLHKVTQIFNFHSFCHEKYVNFFDMLNVFESILPHKGEGLNQIIFIPLPFSGLPFRYLPQRYKNIPLWSTDCHQS